MSAFTGTWGLLRKIKSLQEDVRTLKVKNDYITKTAKRIKTQYLWFKRVDAEDLASTTRDVLSEAISDFKEADTSPSEEYEKRIDEVEIDFSAETGTADVQVTVAESDESWVADSYEKKVTIGKPHA